MQDQNIIIDRKTLLCTHRHTQTHTDDAYIKKPHGEPVLCSKPYRSEGGAREGEEDRITRRTRRRKK